MESLKHAQRPFKLQNASVNSLSGDCDYYRVLLDSEFRIGADDATPSSQIDAEYDIGQLLPNARSNLQDGEWYVYLESFHLRNFTSKTDAICVCLPELILNSKNYRSSATGLRVDDTVAFILGELKPTKQSIVSAVGTVSTNATGMPVAVGGLNIPANSAQIRFAIGSRYQPFTKYVAVGDKIEIYGAMVDDDSTVATGVDAAMSPFVNKEHTVTAVTTNQLQVTSITFAYNPIDADGNAVQTNIANHTPAKVDFKFPIGMSNFLSPENKQKFHYNDMELVYAYRQDVDQLGVGRSVDFNMLSRGRIRVVLKGTDQQTLVGSVAGQTQLLSYY
eukprot:SAG11_NODE_8289_length_1033_cov_30.554604_1_plen_332_part_10